MRIFEFNVPNIGEAGEVAVIEVKVQPGDSVTADQAVIVVESDKATIDVPVPHAGRVKEVALQVGQSVSEGSRVLTLELEEGEQASAPVAAPVIASEAASVAVPVAVDEPAPQAMPAQEPALAATPTSPVSQAAMHRSSPTIRKLARELGVPLAEVVGTGPKGRVLREDVHGYVKSRLPLALQRPDASPASASTAPELDLLPWPKVDFARFGPVQSRPLSRIQKISGANLHRNWVRIPHVTTHEEADITEIESFRIALNAERVEGRAKLTLLPFLIKASAVALRAFPAFNASLEDDALILKEYCHIGFAVDSPKGLVVPVIRDADRKGLFELAADCADLAAAARAGTLRAEQMQGGCFSVSSLGGIGTTGFTPIINAPELAILGVSRSAIRPVWRDNAFVPRQMVPMSLSWDHRAIDGVQAARFSVFLARLLEDFRRIAL